MSLRGVRQLNKLVVRYCDWGGSSRGVREWMRNSLVAFAESNPSVEVKVERYRNRHPCLHGTFLNGTVKSIGIKNLDEKEVRDFVMHLRNQIGRTVGKGYKMPVRSAYPSIQGEWHERMDIIDVETKIEKLEL